MAGKNRWLARPQSVAALLWALTALFTLRVLGQAVQLRWPQPFLPPFDSFQGSGLPYPLPFTAQIVIASVLTRAALTLAQTAGERLIAQEGAFCTHLIVRDVAEPPLMFGAGGVIDLSESDLASRPGLGLHVTGDART